MAADVDWTVLLDPDFPGHPDMALSVVEAMAGRAMSCEACGHANADHGVKAHSRARAAAFVHFATEPGCVHCDCRANPFWAIVGPHLRRPGGPWAPKT